MREHREPQVAYSTQQALMLDESSRRRKAAKVAAVVQHFLGVPDLGSLRILDVGCSGGIVADELRKHGADVVGIDIDIPGVQRAATLYGRGVNFVLGDSERLPIANASFDVVVCNHIYEHVVAPERLFDELRRIVRPGGALYLGLGNRLGVIEPHYRLPFLSWLPRPLAHRYVRASGRASHYHERFETRRGLRRLCRGLNVWDYTFTVIAEPARFEAEDMVPAFVAKLPARVLRVTRPLLPTYIWMASSERGGPKGAAALSAPELVSTR
jgi:2-polyprenyl-3-methyl-5-hydroxy-6-metoxy-1,4-benzoquinol methylase